MKTKRKKKYCTVYESIQEPWMLLAVDRVRHELNMDSCNESWIMDSCNALYFVHTHMHTHMHMHVCEWAKFARFKSVSKGCRQLFLAQMMFRVKSEIHQGVRVFFIMKHTGQLEKGSCGHVRQNAHTLAEGWGCVGHFLVFTRGAVCSILLAFKALTY